MFATDATLSILTRAAVRASPSSRGWQRGLPSLVRAAARAPRAHFLGGRADGAQVGRGTPGVAAWAGVGGLAGAGHGGRGRCWDRARGLGKRGLTEHGLGAAPTEVTACVAA